MSKHDDLLVRLLSLAFFLGGAVIYYAVANEEQELWVIFLFALPLVPIMFSKFTLPRESVYQVSWKWLVAVSGITNTLSIICYTILSVASRPGDQLFNFFNLAGRLLFWFNLAASVALTTYAFWVVSRVLRRRDDDAVLGGLDYLSSCLSRIETRIQDLLNHGGEGTSVVEQADPDPAPDQEQVPREGNDTSDSLVEDIRHQPFPVLCLFLLIFLFIAYHLAFSLALHDRTQRLQGMRPSLNMQGLEKQADLINQGEIEWCRGLAGSIYSKDLYFEDGKFILELDREYLSKLDGSEDTSECAGLDLGKSNACSLHGIAKVLGCCPSRGPVRITLMAPPTRNGGFAVGEARINRSTFEIIKVLDSRARTKSGSSTLFPEILWVSVPMSPGELWRPAEEVPAEDSKGGEAPKHDILRVEVGPIFLR